MMEHWHHDNIFYWQLQSKNTRNMFLTESCFLYRRSGDRETLYSDVTDSGWMRLNAQRQNFKAPATAVTGHKSRNVFKINSIRAAMKIGGITVWPRYSGLLLGPESALRPQHRSSRRCVPYRLRSSVIYCWQNTVFQHLVDSFIQNAFHDQE